MLKVARNSDFRRLVAAYPDHAFRTEDIHLLSEKYPGETMPEGMQWSLKQIGYLHALDVITRERLASVLEIGAGFNFYLPNHLPPSVDYASIDKHGFYEPRMLDLMVKNLPRGRSVDGLMGEFSADLPVEGFDACVSISVLEHVADEKIDDVCKDMWRVIKPNGWAIHSIDLFENQLVSATSRWSSAMAEAGFRVTAVPADFDPSVGDWISDPPHWEPLSIVMRFYSGYKKSIWSKSLSPAPLPNSCTILLAIKKSV